MLSASVMRIRLYIEARPVLTCSARDNYEPMALISLRISEQLCDYSNEFFIFYFYIVFRPSNVSLHIAGST